MADTPTHEALRALLAEADRAEAVMLRECGIGVLNRVVLEQARAALAAADAALSVPAGDAYGLALLAAWDKVRDPGPAGDDVPHPVFVEGFKAAWQARASIPAPAALSVQAEPARDLHAAIMNIPSPAAVEAWPQHRRIDYKTGHRDARHAAAELALAARHPAQREGE